MGRHLQEKSEVPPIVMRPIDPALAKFNAMEMKDEN